MSRLLISCSLFTTCIFSTLAGDATDIRVASPTKGIVSEIMVKKGDRVTRGQILLRLDSRQAQINVRLAELQLTAAQTELLAAIATSKEADVRAERKRQLFEQGAISKEEYDAGVLMQSRYQQEKAVKEVLVGVAKLQVERARLRLEHHEIRCPVAGVVEGIAKDLGEGVKATDTVLRLRRSE